MKNILLLLCFFSITVQAKDFSKVFAKVDPAVVVIHTVESANRVTNDGIKTVSSRGIGSGVIISRDGLIMTAAHVVHSADQVIVQLLDGKSYKAKVLSTSVATDLGLIQMEAPPSDLSFVEPWDSDKVSVGEQVFVIGAPYGLEHTLTVGHLSGRRTERSRYALVDVEFLQTDAGVNQGNSGGPLFNKEGKLIGIVSHIQTQSGGSEGLGFAASINMARRVLLEQTAIWGGVDFIPLPARLTHALNVPYAEGLLIQGVAAGSFGDVLDIRPGTIPAMIGGQDVLLGGDVVVEIGGNTIYVNPKGRQRIVDYIHSVLPGESINVTVIRAGKKVTLSAVRP